MAVFQRSQNMAKKVQTPKAPATLFTLLDAPVVAAVQKVFEHQQEANSSAHTVAVALYDKGFTPESLIVPTKKQPNDAFNKALYLELVNAVILSPRFGELGRETIKRKIAGIQAADADEATRRRLEMGKVNACVKAIRDALKNAHENEGDTKGRKATLHEVIDELLVRGIKAIIDKGDKAGVDVPTLAAAWRDCRAATTAAFKAKVSAK